MRQNFQRFPSNDPARGVYGDCMRTCIASLMDLSTEEVPHFLEDNSDAWLAQLNRWLAPRKQAYLLLPVPDASVLPEFFAQQGQDLFHLMTIRIGSGTFHQIVGRNGQPFWCPIHGDVQGREYEVLEIGFLVCTSL